MSYERVVTVNEVEFRVVFDATPLVAEYISGPPEDCHPAEGGEVEILDIFIGDVNVNQVISELVDKEIQSKLEEDIAEITEPDFDEPDFGFDDSDDD